MVTSPDPRPGFEAAREDNVDVNTGDWLLESAALIRRVMKNQAVEAVVPLGDGCDHWAFEVNGSLIARVRKHTDDRTAGAVEKEVALLDVLSRVSPIRIPEVVAAEPHAGVIVFRRIPGRSLHERPLPDPLAIAEPLAAFVASLHALPAAAVEHLLDRDEYPISTCLADAAAQIERVATHLTAAQQRRIERFLSSPAPPESVHRTVCHNDLGAEHVLVSEDGSVLTGIIDWSDAAIADPARDLGLLLRDLGFAVADVIARGMDEATVLTRALFYARCALLEDLAYGIGASRPTYVAHSLARFAETFSGP
jgi:aminoglycoside phosphotransferase (APT) family kinase protein